MSFLDTINPDQTCLVPIDVQEMFCNHRYWRLLKFLEPWEATPRTDLVAHKIGGITPQFNALSVDVAWVYYTNDYNLKKPFKMAGKLYGVNPAPQDAIIPKIETSAFWDVHDRSTPFEKWLKNNNKTHLIVCGFYLTACVYETVMSAAKRGYKVTVLTDLSTDGKMVGKPEETHRNALMHFIDSVRLLSPKLGERIELLPSHRVLQTLRQKKAHQDALWPLNLPLKRRQLSPIV